MTDFSIKELEALCQRAARGAYMPWGLAEDAARAVGWLEKASLPCLPQFVGLLRLNDGADMETLTVNHHDDRTLTKAGGNACPILTGTYLCDAQQTLDLDNGVQIEQVAYPCLLLPFLSGISVANGCDLAVGWSNFEAIVYKDGVQISSGHADLESSLSEQVQITKRVAALHTDNAPQTRVQVGADDLSALTGFAARTYLPETELSRATGAGGGSVDDG